MDLYDDALGLVLERVDSHVSLIRAAAVCRRWRRAIADAAFLRRYRSLYAPPVAGYYHTPSPQGGTRYGPVFVTSSPSIVHAGHFSLDFLPGGAESWSVRDSRGSLLVLFVVGGTGAFPDIVICEPLTRRCIMAPPPPDSRRSGRCWGPFLLDGKAKEVGGRITMDNFRLLCVFNYNGVILTSIFTEGSSWSEKNIDPMVPSIGPQPSSVDIVDHASGSWYFYIGDGSRTLLHLDGTTGEFTSSVLPAIEDWGLHIQRSSCALTEGCDGKPRIITTPTFDGTMKVFARLDSTKWALEKKILLSEATYSLGEYRTLSLCHYISTTGVGFVIVSRRFEEPRPFSVNLETMEAAPAAKNMGWKTFQCKLPWPPVLHTCLDR